MKLIVGLGNPGEKYTKTRHNLGFMVVDELVKSAKGQVQSREYEKKFKAEIIHFDLSLSTTHLSLILAKPQTYMNNSGMAVSALSNYYKIKPEDIIVIHDDLDLLLGKIKVRLGGAAGGHHGVESVIKSLASDQFVRLRVGIGNQKSHSGEHERVHFNAEKFVLESFMPGEKTKIKQALKQAMEALNLLLNQGLETTQNKFN